MKRNGNGREQKKRVRDRNKKSLSEKVPETIKRKKIEEKVGHPKIETVEKRNRPKKTERLKTTKKIKPEPRKQKDQKRLKRPEKT